MAVIGLDFGNTHSFPSFVLDMDPQTRRGGVEQSLLPAETRYNAGIPTTYYYSQRQGEKFGAAAAAANPVANQRSMLKRHFGETEEIDGKLVDYNDVITRMVEHIVQVANQSMLRNFRTTTNQVSLAYPVTFLHTQVMQLVQLVRDGQPVRMSKRTGKAISLSDLLDEIPVDAARYFFNSRPESPVEFDLELAVRQDSENPVYYVQYAHARICTMLAALAAEGHSVPSDADASLLTQEAELELIKQLAALPEEIRLAARDYDPSRINKYVTELAARFHKFYTVCRIKDAEPGLLEARLLLADCVRRVIAVSLGIIGVSAPEKM